MHLREFFDRIDDDEYMQCADELDHELAEGPPSAADNFFYCVFVIAMAFVISHQGWYAPGL